MRQRMELFIMALQVIMANKLKSRAIIKRGSFVGLLRQRRVRGTNSEWIVGTGRREGAESPA